MFISAFSAEKSGDSRLVRMLRELLDLPAWPVE